MSGNWNDSEEKKKSTVHAKDKKIVKLISQSGLHHLWVNNKERGTDSDWKNTQGVNVTEKNDKQKEGERKFTYTGA